MPVSRRSLARALAILTPILAGCRETATAPALAPVPRGDASLAAVCSMNVAERALTCAQASTSLAGAGSGGASYDRIVGGQDMYVRLSSSGTAFDAGTEILSTNVTVQNLTRSMMGTTDGTTMSTLRVFFEEQPTVTAGTGTVTVANPDGIGTFTNSGQPYFEYQQMLHSYEISSSRVWQFNVPATVGSFRFAVYVSAPMQNETASSTLLDLVWNGLTDSAWLAGYNWGGGSTPADTSTVVIPAAATLDPSASQPSLTANDSIANLRVGSGSTLSLGGFTLSISGNVDALGSIAGGTTLLTGSGALVGGNVDKLVVTGNASLQRSTTATGAVSVTDGSLSTSAYPLSIQIP
jgi:hypothetical protein